MKITIEVTGPSEAEVAIETLSTFRDAALAAKTDTTTKATLAKTKATPAKTKAAPAKTKTKAKTENKETDDTTTLTLKELTAIAKEAVARTDRQAAKDVISKYGSKLSAVAEEDYADLAKDLEDL